MIYVITVYWKSNFWVERQLQNLNNFSESGTEVLVFRDRQTDVPEYNYDNLRVRIFDDGGVRSHAEKLNILASFACSEAQDEDILVFLDSDAFPIASYQDFISQELESFGLVAVRRDENLEPQPHPCFCAIKVGTWKRIRGDWRKGPLWTDLDGHSVTDVGATLGRQLKEAAIDWYPLLRSNKKNYHNSFYAIYGGIVYHHGCGSDGRDLVSRSELKWLSHSRWFRVIPGVIRVRILKAVKYRYSRKNRDVDLFIRAHLDDVNALKNILMQPANG